MNMTSAFSETSPGAQPGVLRFSRFSMLRRRSLWITALSVSAVIACIIPMLPSIGETPAETPAEQPSIAFPTNDTGVSSGGGKSIHPVKVKVLRGESTNESSPEEWDEEHHHEQDAERGRGEGTEACPLCTSLFEKLEQTRLGKAAQDVKLQVRGEPKSGTSFMFEWAINSLAMTCQFLEQLYGKETCSLRWNRVKSRLGKGHKMDGKASVVDMKIVTMTFEPKAHKAQKKQSLAMAAPCTCEGVNRVTVEISHLFKHYLPVVHCPWQHLDDIAREGDGCSHFKGRRVQNYTDVLGCMRESPCRINDDRLQMLVIRDPRAVAVSSYFWRLTHRTSSKETVEHYALRMLPTICQYTHLRYVLLLEGMPEITEEFDYDDSVADPLQWHRDWLAFVGLNLTESVVREISDKDSRREYIFMAKGADKHPGGEKATPSRSFRDEVSEEVAAEMDRIAKVWMPPSLLKKFGIPLDAGIA